MLLHIVIIALLCPTTGLIQPELLPDGQVCVDMGEPILEGPKVPTTLSPTQGSTVIKAPLTVDGKTYAVTCVSMGNPHAIIYSADGKDVEVGGRCTFELCMCLSCGMHRAASGADVATSSVNVAAWLGSHII